MAQVQAMRTRVTRQQVKVAQIEKQTLDQAVQAIAANRLHSTVVQAVDQQQSFELVQTLLMSSVFERSSHLISSII